jgi:hypothetical protein
MIFGSPPPAAAVPLFMPTLGFEDDVDIVPAPLNSFLVVPEEEEDGSAAQLTLVDLDLTTGQPIGGSPPIPVLGFENGVDPFVVQIDGGQFAVLVPTESEDGSEAEVILLRVDDAAAVLEEIHYPLGDLGFREDVDATPAPYHAKSVVFPLESEDRTVRGLLLIDVDVGVDGTFGDCLLLSTDVRTACAGNAIQVDWLSGLAEGVDPLAFEMDDRTRVVLPVQSAAGADLLLVDFDPSVDPPVWLDDDADGQPVSVEALNAGGAHPTPMHGFERDVDLAVLSGCGLGARSILVPVEGDGDVGDLYLLDENGVATWVLSEQATPLGLTIPGYEMGVDVVLWCGIPAIANPDRLVVPLETASGMDADLWIVDLPTGAILARAEDPTRNPGLVLPGYEMGVEPLLWTAGDLLVPVERLDGIGGLLVLDPNAGVEAAASFTGFGFEKSVDPVRDFAAAPSVIFVPVATPDGADQDVLILRAPPGLGWQSLEASNPGTTVSGFERDVDLGLIEKTVAAAEWLYLPEENAAGTDARLRFHPVPQEGRYLVMATQLTSVLPGTLAFVRVATGNIDFAFPDLLGLESGLDMASKAGPVTTGNPPLDPFAGADFDTDPTLGWAGTATDARWGGADAGIRIRHANPYRVSGEIRFSLPEASVVRLVVVDVAGRRVRELMHGPRHAGQHAAAWDLLDERREGVPSGVYFVQVHTAR